jgi:hypothetical protein
MREEANLPCSSNRQVVAFVLYRCVEISGVAGVAIQPRRAVSLLEIEAIQDRSPNLGRGNAVNSFIDKAI